MVKACFMNKYLVEGIESTSDLLFVIDSFNITKQKGKVNSFFLYGQA